MKNVIGVLSAVLALSLLGGQPALAQEGGEKPCCKSGKTEVSVETEVDAEATEKPDHHRSEIPGLDDVPGEDPDGEHSTIPGLNEQPSEGDFEKTEIPGLDEQPSEGDFEKTEIPGLDEQPSEDGSDQE